MKRRYFLHAIGTGIGASTLAACGGGGDSLDTSAASDAEALALEQASKAGTTAPQIPAGPAKSRVIVVGGGMAGASVAKYLRLWGDRIEVTLVERQSTYTSNIMSSLVLTGQRSMASLAYGYDTLRKNYGVKVVLGDVTAIDPVQVKVTLASGQVLSADRIVLAPGIEFDAVPGLGSSTNMPHAWKAGPQTSLLASQLKAMRSGGTAILSIPKVPYRCPPGPYERACLLADWMRVNKPGSKLIVLDANPDIVTERDNFMSAEDAKAWGLIDEILENRGKADDTSK